MKPINLIEALDATFSQTSLTQLSVKFGLSPEFLRHIIAWAGPALLASLMANAATERGVSQVFTAVVSDTANAGIAGQLHDLIATTMGLKKLEAAGETLAIEGISVHTALVSDYVAGQTGVPVQAAYAMSGIIAAALFGILKHHVLLEQGLKSALPQLLAEQWPVLESDMTDTLAGVLRFENAAAFRDSIPAQLRVLSGKLRRAEVQDAPPEAVVPQEPIATSVADNRTATSRRRWLFIGVAIVLSSAGAVTASLRCLHRDSSPPGQVVVGAVSNYSPLPASVPAPVTATVPASGIVVNGAVQVAIASGAAPASSSNAVIAAAASTAATLSARNMDRSEFGFGVNRVGAPNLTATVTNEQEKVQILTLLERQLGAGRYTADITVDSHGVNQAWLVHMNALVPLMRMPRTDLTLDGKNIELGGHAADPTTGWVERVQTLFGPDYRVSVFKDDQAIAQATRAFREAMTRQVQTASCNGVDDVLNRQVIDFAHGSAHVPSSAKHNLDESAQLLKVCADRGQLVDLTIEAFTDDVGEAQANLDLSIKRAGAIRAFLVQAGVPASSLAARGYGPARPVASNLTARGRFANRRIMFVTTRGGTTESISGKINRTRTE